MGSKRSSKRSIYGPKEYPGCMGGLIHLFDFNQALGRRKLLTDNKFAGFGSKEAGRGEALKSNASTDEEIPYGYEVHKAPPLRKTGRTPIKALYTQDPSTGLQAKNQPPSVVARLMGLDALPDELKDQQKHLPTQNKGGRSSSHRSPLVRQQHLEAKSPHNAGVFAKKAKAPVTSSMYSQENDLDDGKVGFEPFSFHDHPQEQQLQEFKKDFASWQNQKIKDRAKKSSSLNDLDAQLGGIQVLVPEKQPNARLTPSSHERLSPLPSNSAQERLHESREFLDAMDFLHSNKEFFVRFLQEPNYLFAKDKEIDGGHTVNHRPSHRESDARDDPPQARKSPDSRGNHRREQNYQEGLDMTDATERRNSSFGLEESLRLQYRRKLGVSSSSDDIREHIEDGRKPTRIVVLKPSSGGVRHVKSLSSCHLGFLKDQVSAKELMHEDNVGVLEKLKEQLRKDQNGKHSYDNRERQPNAGEHRREKLKDPREIAREIARQVRENVTRDLMVNSGQRICTDHFSGREKHLGRPAQFSRQLSDGDNYGGSSDGEFCTAQPSRGNNCDAHSKGNTGSIRRNKSLAMNSGKDGKRRTSSRPIMISSECSNDLPPQLRNTELRSTRILPEEGFNSISELKCSHSCASGKHGENVSQHHQEAFSHSDKERSDHHSRSSSLDFEIDPLVRSEEETREKSPWTLPRSRSAPIGSTSMDCSQDELSRKASGLKNNISLNRRHITSKEAAMDSVSFGSAKTEARGVKEDTTFVCEEMAAQMSTNKGQTQGEANEDYDVFASLSDEKEVDEMQELLPEDSPRSAVSASCSDAAFVRASVDSDAMQLEQPSPVSVLDVPYQDDLGDGLPVSSSDGHKPELGPELCTQQEEVIITTKNRTFQVHPEQPEAMDDRNEGLLYHETNLDDMHCPSGKEVEMLYVKDVLVASNFYGMDSSNISNELCPPKMPLDLRVFQKLENSYCGKELPLLGIEKEICTASMPSSMRHLLFDCVNDVLFELLGASRQQQWSHSHKLRIFPTPCERDLFKHVWSKVCHLSCAQSRAQNTLERLVSRDLSKTKGDRWLDLSPDKDAIRSDVERAIFDDLIEETLLVM